MPGSGAAVCAQAIPVARPNKMSVPNNLPREDIVLSVPFQSAPGRLRDRRAIPRWRAFADGSGWGPGEQLVPTQRELDRKGVSEDTCLAAENVSPIWIAVN